MAHKAMQYTRGDKRKTPDIDYYFISRAVEKEIITKKGKKKQYFGSK